MRTIEITLPPTEVTRPIMKLSDLKDRADVIEQVLPARITSTFSPANTRIMILPSRPAPHQQPRAKPGFVHALPLSCRLFILTLTALLAGITVPAVAQNAPAPTNLLPNPSFEQKIEVGVQGWKSRAWSGETAARWTIASQYSMADALFSASFLNACLRHAEDVGMANIAPIVNTRGPLFVHPKGLVKRTTFHTLALYANHLENRVSRIDVDAGMLIHGEEFIPVVDAVATVDKTGKTWAIALVNRHPSKEVDCTVKMENVPIQGTHGAIVLSGDSPEAYNDVEHPNRVAPKRTRITFNQGVASLAPHSLTLLKFAAH
ncbi:MAG TPA: alpha-L-arabinofuranosidase C-terminal domain-containing protein [Candidatus Paceibacterota bacterium]|nr:alpha-L-arabinofuranosidase C-terminal domain-containing protein [Candidatus Paceibacterota bacterium]